MDTIQPESAVTIRYDMVTHLPDGAEKLRSDETIEFIYMVERQVPTLEKALGGREVGEKFTVRVPQEELYGGHDPELIREIPKKGLVKQRLREGQYYRQIKQSTLVSFKVLEVRPDTVLVDFNKPMAGITVTMDVEVMAIRHPSKDEIDTAREADHRRSIGCE